MNKPQVEQMPKLKLAVEETTVPAPRVKLVVEETVYIPKFKVTER